MGSEEIDHGSARNSTEGEGEGATRASDEELARQSYDAYPDIAIAGNIVAWYYLLSESQKRHIARAAAVRARVEAPLLAEIAELRGEVSRIRGIADTFCVERNNVMKERDCIKSELTASQARVAELEAMGVPNDHCITCGGITDEGDALVWQHERCAENVRLRAELEAVKAERDSLRISADSLAARVDTLGERNAALQSELAAVKAERDESSDSRDRLMLIVEQQAQELQDDPQFRECRKDLGRAQQDLAALRAQLDAVTAERDGIERRRDALDKDLIILRGSHDRLRSELAALRQPDAVPVEVRWNVTAAQVEALARAIKQWMGDHPASGWDGIARAAFAHIGRVPVDTPALLPDLTGMSRG